MITKEGFIQSANTDPEKSGKIFDELNDRFNGDWEKAAEYLENVVAYLEKHKH